MPLTNPNTVEILDEGISQGNVSRVDFTGAGIAATVVGDTATVTAGGGGGSGLAQFEVLKLVSLRL